MQSIELYKVIPERSCHTRVKTIVITIQQNELNKANHTNDMDIAQKQRQQDLLIGNKTQEQDRESNTQQRQQEQFLADQQG
ncbi:unnamed protein product [Rotaria sp. Silwood2]|nr:unnamed protein product [Rotaria sp. Silwood2]CAF4308976.1 unnamed protein product [Rotaria sp. Silwood2]